MERMDWQVSWFQICFQEVVSRFPRENPWPSQLWQGTTVPSGATAMLERQAPHMGTDRFNSLRRAVSARPGEVLAITGDNGVGKSTLSRCLCGLMPESAGTIRLNGRVLGPKQRQRIAYCVMQDVNHQLFSDSVWGESRLAAEGLSDQRIQEVLDRLHLLAFREKHPMALSGGQKQRLAVATAMLSQKPLLVFDEPTSGLDYARMQEVACCARELADGGRVVLVVTHDREFLQCACDRVLEL